jgi:hypothetical protein
MVSARNCAEAPLNTTRVVVILLSFFLVNLSLLIFLSNHYDYNGDALNMIIPMLHLDEAKRGELLSYRYPWQPLSYELGAAIFQITKSPDAVFLLAPVFGSLTLTMLLLITWRDRTSIPTFLASLVTLLAIPEFWFSSLYFNSTILGMPFFLTAIAIMWAAPGRLVSLVAGLLVSVAILMRLDFILICPAVALLAWTGQRSLKEPFAFAAGVLIGLALADFDGCLDLVKAFEVYRSATAEIVEKSNTPGWDMNKKVLVISLMFSPLGWMIILLGAPLALIRSLRRDICITLLWLVALLPAMQPLLNLLSVKYALPFLTFLPGFMRQCLEEIERKVPDRFRAWPLSLAATGTVGLLFVSFSFYGHPPYVQIGTLAPRPINTHTGPRSFGGYLWQAIEVHKVPLTPEKMLADQIVDEFLKPSGPDVVIAGGEDFFDRGGIGWRLVQLNLERLGFHGRVTAPHQVEFTANGRKLTLVRDLYPKTATAPRWTPGNLLYDLRN